jgi:hypothetical protein
MLLVKKKERFLLRSLISYNQQLTFLLGFLITPSEAFHSAGGVNNSLLTGVIWMALTAQLYADFLFG